MPLLLLDFDGVVLRNHPVYSVVSHRCQRFLQKHVPIRNPAKLKQLNQELYECYGHTALGLKAMGYCTEISDFNSYVYGNINLESLFSVKDTHAQDIKEFKAMIMRVKENSPETDIRLFTNAPDVWCQTVLQFMGMDAIPKLNMHGLLKPNHLAYERVENMFPSERHIIFMDDKMINLRSVMRRPTWERILYTGTDATDVTHTELPNVSILNKVSHLTDTRAWQKGTAHACLHKDSAVKSRSKRMTQHISSG